MPDRVLTGSHAEDVGGAIVEPGDPIPDGADDDVVERLDAEGKLGDAEPESKSKRGAK